MKNIIYIIIGTMALVFLANLSAVDETSTIKLVENGQILEINPLY